MYIYCYLIQLSDKVINHSSVVSDILRTWYCLLFPRRMFNAVLHTVIRKSSNGSKASKSNTITSQRLPKPWGLYSGMFFSDRCSAICSGSRPPFFLHPSDSLHVLIELQMNSVRPLTLSRPKRATKTEWPATPTLSSVAQYYLQFSTISAFSRISEITPLHLAEWHQYTWSICSME